MKTLTILIFTAFMLNNGLLFGQKSERIFSYRVGGAEVILLSEGQYEGENSILLDAAPEVIEAYASNGTFAIATNAFLIRTPERLILVDAGYGRRLFENLEAVGVKPEDIGVILITHMHGDHINGLLRDEKIAFPNAVVHIAAPELSYWRDNKAMKTAPEEKQGGFANAQKIFSLYQSKVKMFQPNELGKLFPELLPGVWAFSAFGHTPGHTVFLLESDGEQLLIWGDLTHAMSVQIPHPEIAVTYDVDPQQAVATRLKILEYVVENHIPIAGMHIPYPAIGTIEAEETGGYRFIPAK